MVSLVYLLRQESQYVPRNQPIKSSGSPISLLSCQEQNGIALLTVSSSLWRAFASILTILHRTPAERSIKAFFSFTRARRNMISRSNSAFVLRDSAMGINQNTRDLADDQD